MRDKSKKKKAVLFSIGAAAVLAACAAAVYLFLPPAGPASEARFHVFDYIELGDYIGVRYDPVETQVAGWEIEERIHLDLLYLAETVEVSGRGTQIGDTLIMDFAGYIDGVSFSGGRGYDYEVTLGSGEPFPEFEELLFERIPGQSFDISVRMPLDHRDEHIAGRAADFTITIKSATASILPEFDDEFVRENTWVSTVGQYRAMVEMELRQEKEEQAEKSEKEQIWAAVLDGATVTQYPEEQLSSRIAALTEEHEEYASMSGMSLGELALAFYGISEQELMEGEIPRMARDTVKRDLVLRAIAEAQGLAVSEAEFNEGAHRLATEYGFENVEEFLGEAPREAVLMALLTEQVIDFLFKNAIPK